MSAHSHFVHAVVRLMKRNMRSLGALLCLIKLYRMHSLDILHLEDYNVEIGGRKSHTPDPTQIQCNSRAYGLPTILETYPNARFFHHNACVPLSTVSSNEMKRDKWSACSFSLH